MTEKKPKTPGLGAARVNSVKVIQPCWLISLKTNSISHRELEHVSISQAADGNSPGSPGAGRAAVGVCTANRPEMLRCCLAALASQIVPEGFDLTIIVADNDPEPGIEQAVAEFAATAQRPRACTRGVAP